MHLTIDATPTQSKAFSGIGQYTKNLIIELVRNYPNTQFSLLLFEAETTIPDSILDMSNLNVVSLGQPLNKFMEILLYKLRIAPALKKIVSEDPDVVFFSPYFIDGFPLDGVKTVLTIHDFALAEFNYYSDRGGVYGLIRKNEYWYHLNRTVFADAIVTVSENTALDYMKYFPNFDTNKVHPIMLGIELEEKVVDIDHYLPKDWKERGYFIYMGGGIQKSKNSEGVVNAYAKYLELFTDNTGMSMDNAPYLVIAGKIFTNKNFPQSISLRHQIDDLGLSHNVHFSGYYDDVSKFSLLNNSIAFIHLSLFEGFGISVAEAMRVGKPVIVHNGTSYPEVVGDAGFLVDGTDADEVAATMFKVQTDEELVKEIGLKARERSFMFDWKKTAKETMDVFKAVANGD